MSILWSILSVLLLSGGAGCQQSEVYQEAGQQVADWEGAVFSRHPALSSLQCAASCLSTPACNAWSLEGDHVVFNSAKYVAESANISFAVRARPAGLPAVGPHRQHRRTGGAALADPLVVLNSKEPR